MQHTSTYRPDIDGLRAVAVLAVVFNHAGLTWLPGGFAGVDVFFVISGYLITRILMQDIQDNRFSLVTFYTRRARRILPALFVMILACFVAGWFMLPPNTFEILAKSAIAALFFVSNIWFWRSSGDYFGTSAEFNPLLHTWSLAVEEQFYLVFPLLLWALVRQPRHIWILVIATASLMSFALSLWATTAEPVASFYLAPTRAWELGLGVLLALGAFPVLRHQAAVSTVATTGLVLIIASFVFLTESASFPGMGALAPCLGATFVIWAGLHGQSPVFRLLSRPPMIWIGLLSYSLYLWHWPVLVGARHLSDSSVLSAEIAALCVLLSILLAWASLHLVERPFRTQGSSAFLPQRHIFVFSASSTAVLVGFAFVVTLQNGFPQRVPPQTRAIVEASQESHALDVACRNQSIADAPCTLGAPATGTRPVEVVIWGDSHAGAMLVGLDQWLRDQGIAARAFVKLGCPPLLDVSVSVLEKQAKVSCEDHNSDVAALIETTPSIHTVILAARWQLATEGSRTHGEFGAPMFLTTPGAKGDSAEQNPEWMRKGLEQVAVRLSAQGKDMVIIGSVPELSFHAPEAILRNATFGARLPQGPSREAFDRRNAKAQKILEDVRDRFGATLLFPADFLCTAHCRFVHDDRIMYRDDDHLSIFGARWLAAQMLTDIKPENRDVGRRQSSNTVSQRPAVPQDTPSES